MLESSYTQTSTELSQQTGNRIIPIMMNHPWRSQASNGLHIPKTFAIAVAEPVSKLAASDSWQMEIMTMAKSRLMLNWNRWMHQIRNRVSTKPVLFGLKRTCSNNFIRINAPGFVPNYELPSKLVFMCRRENTLKYYFVSAYPGSGQGHRIPNHNSTNNIRTSETHKIPTVYFTMSVVKICVTFKR